MTRYSTDHVWVDVEGERAKAGITDFARKQLGDVVYVELPEVGTVLVQGRPFGRVESAKAISELYAPVSGDVVEINTWLQSQPETLNTDPESSWLVAITLTKPKELDGLLSAEQYADLVK